MKMSAVPVQFPFNPKYIASGSVKNTNIAVLYVLRLISSKTYNNEDLMKQTFLDLMNSNKISKPDEHYFLYIRQTCNVMQQQTMHISPGTAIIAVLGNSDANTHAILMFGVGLGDKVLDPDQNKDKDKDKDSGSERSRSTLSSDDESESAAFGFGVYDPLSNSVQYYETMDALKHQYKYDMIRFVGMFDKETAENVLYYSSSGGSSSSAQNMVYDTVIIGGGVAGMYTALKIQKANPSAKVIVLEKHSHVGGRIGQDMFAGVLVSKGAGVGRKEKDVLLWALLKELGIDGESSESVIHKKFITSHPRININSIVKRLKDIYNQNPTLRTTFKRFALAHMSAQDYKDFVNETGYSDYENADAYDTLYNYELDDCAAGWTTFSVPWNAMIDGLHSRVPVKTNTEVVRIRSRRPAYPNASPQQSQQSGGGGFSNAFHRVECRNGKTYMARTVVLATTIGGLMKLLPKYPLYKHIKSNHFLRIYGQLSTKCRLEFSKKVPVTTIVQGPLQKIIPINHEKGVYMICYCDSKSADNLATSAHLTKEYLENELQMALGMGTGMVKLTKIKAYDWPEGTHYYPILPRQYSSREAFIHDAQRPHPSIYVVGEVVARNQGWTQGALESVENVIKEIII